MRIATMAVAGLMAGAAVTASPAHADPVVVDPDPVVAVQELQGQIADLHDNWGALSPDERQQRIKVLQRQATLVDAETRNLDPLQQLQVQGMLLSATFQLADVLRLMR